MSDLLTRCRPVALAIAADFHWQGADRDDVRQEALLALVEAERAWDRRGAFVSFARVCIKRHLLDCLRVANGRPAAPKPRLVELVVDPPNVVSLEEHVANRERLRAVLASPLTDRERAVLARAVQGYSYSEVGEELDLSPAVVKWTAWKARSRLRAAA